MDDRDRRALDGRVAVVTGGSRGIGRALVLAPADARAAGTIHSVAGEVRSRGGRALAIRADVRHEMDVETLIGRTVEEYGRIEILAERGWSARDLDSYRLTGSAPESPLWIDGWAG